MVILYTVIGIIVLIAAILALNTWVKKPAKQSEAEVGPNRP